MDLGLRGKVALVTGSYRGTGAGIAEVLAAEGASVWVHGFEAGQPEPVVDRLREMGGDVHAVVGDILGDEGADALAADVMARADHVDVLVNNYGVASEATGSARRLTTGSRSTTRTCSRASVSFMHSCPACDRGRGDESSSSAPSATRDRIPGCRIITLRKRRSST